MEDGKELSCFRRYAFRPNIKPSDVLLDLEILSTRKAAGANQICAQCQHWRSRAREPIAVRQASLVSNLNHALIYQSPIYGTRASK